MGGVDNLIIQTVMIMQAVMKIQAVMIIQTVMIILLRLRLQKQVKKVRKRRKSVRLGVWLRLQTKKNIIRGQ